MPRGWIPGAPDWLHALLGAGIAVVLAILLHRVVIFLARRTAARTRTLVDDAFIMRLCGPSRWLLIAIALTVVQPALPLETQAALVWRRAAGLLVPALFGWLAVAVLGAAYDVVLARTDISVADNLRARRRHTRAAILYRIALFVILLVTLCMMLISIPAVRSIGITLVASAGLAGLAIGAAAQPALKNLVAGVQMAFTEPIRIDDVVIIDGEWGRIEQIRLTFVVIKIWDERRLVVPVSKFLEESFQNWTRETAQLLGTAFIQVDPTADVPCIRAKLEEIVRASPHWDGRVVGLQVTDVQATHMELRALVSAADASRQFDLRCDVREALMAFLANDMPEALPRRRGLIAVEGGRPAAPAVTPALDARFAAP